MAKTQPAPEDQRFSPGDIAAFSQMTDIDRRGCTRVVPMKVLGLGLSRTGTTSMRQALIDLGYKDCYQYASLLQENPRDQDLWLDAYDAKFRKGKPWQRRDWDQLLGHCQAVTDTPCNVFYRELLDAYPEAKVVLTVRDNPDVWFESMMATIIPYVERVQPKGVVATVWRWFMPIDRRFYHFLDTQIELSPVFRLLMRDRRDGTERAKKWYVDYIEEIRGLVPPERLLVMNVKEGWKPLCGFLGVEEPLYPFPRKNDTVTFQRNTSDFDEFATGVAKWNMLKAVGSVLAVGVAAVVGAHRYGILRDGRISLLR